MLPQFHHLHELGVAFLGPDPRATHSHNRADAAELKSEFQAIRKWGDLCPALRVCTLQSQSVLLRVKSGL